MRLLLIVVCALLHGVFALRKCLLLSGMLIHVRVSATYVQYIRSLFNILKLSRYLRKGGARLHGY